MIDGQEKKTTQKSKNNKTNVCVQRIEQTDRQMKQKKTYGWCEIFHFTPKIYLCKSVLNSEHSLFIYYWIGYLDFVFYLKAFSYG